MLYCHQVPHYGHGEHFSTYLQCLHYYFEPVVAGYCYQITGLTSMTSWCFFLYQIRNLIVASQEDSKSNSWLYQQPPALMCCNHAVDWQIWQAHFSSMSAEMPVKFQRNQTTLNPDLNSSPPSAAYMCKWIGSALVQIMACRLFGAKPLSEPMLEYCWLDP